MHPLNKAVCQSQTPALVTTHAVALSTMIAPPEDSIAKSISPLSSLFLLGVLSQ